MSDHRVKPGDVLGGKYEVLRVLGEGGMGVVVAARHLDLGQTVALKFMLKEAMADPSQAERFLREAKAAVRLKSEHTARVLDVGRLDDNEPYMVMEYLEGRDLDAELHARGRLALPTAVDYVLQASEALAEAHGLGMIHRDVKLKNLFLTQTVDRRPLVKVLDFGLAKTTIGNKNDVSLTATNSVFGSPQYMSPEQMRSAKDVDVRSDIWSMGVCLFELVTGRVPFDATGVAEICAMVLKDPVPRPSQFVRGIPADLENVILRCLEKPPQNRYQSFGELAIALQPYAPDQGSARRVLNVMNATKRDPALTVPYTAVPPSHVSSSASASAATLDAAASAAAAGSTPGRTISTWDSAIVTTSRFRLSRAQWLAVISLCGTLALVGIVVIVFVKTGGPKIPQFSKQTTTIDVPALPPPVEADPPPPLASAVVAAPPPAAQTTPTVAASATSGASAAEAAPPPPTDNGATAPPKVKGRGTTGASPLRLTPLVATPPRPVPVLPVPSAKPLPPKPKGPGSGAEYM